VQAARFAGVNKANMLVNGDLTAENAAAHNIVLDVATVGVVDSF
jgi:hypothetical protein